MRELHRSPRRLSHGPLVFEERGGEFVGGLGKLHQDLFLELKMSEFFEAIWHGEGVGDGGDLEEALQSYIAVKPEEGDWVEACAAEGADPVIERFASFEAYLDNADPLERIVVTPQMISDALALLPS